MRAQTELLRMKRASLPRLDWRTMIAAGTDQLSKEDTEAMDAYFAQFIQIDLAEDGERRCPCCGSSFGKNGVVGWLMAGAEGHATLKWGIANGEAHCSKCSYPFRVYHRGVGPIEFLNVSLAYHPDELKVKK